MIAHEGEGVPNTEYLSAFVSHGRLCRLPALQQRAATITTPNNAQTIYRRRARIENLRTTFTISCCLVFYIGSPMRCTTLSNPQASPTSWLTTTTIHHGDSQFLSSSRASSLLLDHLHPLQDMLCTRMASNTIPDVILSPIHQFNTTTRIRSPITLHRRTPILINNIS